jgi:hypothetical protein
MVMCDYDNQSSQSNADGLVVGLFRIHPVALRIEVGPADHIWILEDLVGLLGHR